MNNIQKVKLTIFAILFLIFKHNCKFCKKLLSFVFVYLEEMVILWLENVWKWRTTYYSHKCIFRVWLGVDDSVLLFCSVAMRFIPGVFLARPHLVLHPLQQRVNNARETCCQPSASEHVFSVLFRTNIARTSSLLRRDAVHACTRNLSHMVGERLKMKCRVRHTPHATLHNGVMRQTR